MWLLSHHRYATLKHMAGFAVDRNQVALAERPVPEPTAVAAAVDPQGAASDDTHLSHLTGHDGGVRRPSSQACEHAHGGIETADVIRRHLGPYQDDRLFPGHLLRFRRIERDSTRDGTQARRNPRRDRDALGTRLHAGAFDGVDVDAGQSLQGRQRSTARITIFGRWLKSKR